MLPELIRFGPLTLSSFTATTTLAFVAAGLLMQQDFARKGEPPELAWRIVVAAILGGVGAAHAEFVAYHWREAMQAPLAAVGSWAGMVWYAGLLGGVAATAWPIRRAGVAWTSAADTAAPALALGLAIARVGCHLVGDGDWGTPTTLPWGVAYVHGVKAWPHPPGVAVHPAALYESIALLGLFVVLWQVRRRTRPDGTLFATYLVAASVIRFAVETVRTNPSLWLGLTEAQWVSVALAGGAAMWLAPRASAGVVAPRDLAARAPRLG